MPCYTSATISDQDLADLQAYIMTFPNDGYLGGPAERGSSEQGAGASQADGGQQPGANRAPGGNDQNGGGRPSGEGFGGGVCGA